MVMSVLHGSPAHKSGIRPGDVLLQVDGHDLKDRTLDEVIDLVVGPAGTSLRLSVGREGQAEPLDLRLTRERIEVPDVTWHMLPGHPVAHIAIGSFGEKVHDQLKEALAGARQQGARGLILDVRGNTGGLKDMAVAVTSEFLANGTVYIEQDADGRREPVAVTPGGTATDLPLVLLLDEGTASSAEILAGAVQDQGRAKLVGTRTFGTGTVLQPFELSDGSVVLLAVAQWLTPKGRQIWHQGITPDIVVTLPNEASIILPEEANGLDAAALAKSEDRQLLKALEVLKLELR
jgi:carboxyl-terminal processing protease